MVWGLAVAPAVAQPPPKEETDRVKSKASMFDDDLDMATGGTIKKAQEKADTDYKKLRKNRTYKAIKKKQAEEARRRKALAEKKKREAAEAKRRAKALKNKEIEAARKLERTERKAAKAKTKAEIAEVKKSGLSKAEKKARIAEIRAEAKLRRANRKARLKTQREEAQARFQAARGDMKDANKYLREAKKHNRRLARLHRVQEVAADVGDDAALARANQALEKEQARHAKSAAGTRGATMNRSLYALPLMIGLFACDTGSAPASAPPKSGAAAPAAEAKPAEVPAPTPAAKDMAPAEAEAATDDVVAVEADFEEEADKEITETTYQAELDALEKAIATSE